MSTTMTSKGQVTIPKRIREALRIEPGDRIDFDVDCKGRVLIQPVRPAADRKTADRFEAVRGRASIRWRTEDLMRLLRDDD
ncbi:MAG: AbrB/MazE/SpoVT family DNA-binding domain-containing protein [Burkholderiaceae bacterium]|nr:AbrB/MazE/SpoVT family DNA-binding domain-containing protein [Burkholderiaceae bacterium]